jgi:hypothetical protein
MRPFLKLWLLSSVALSACSDSPSAPQPRAPVSFAGVQAMDKRIVPDQYIVVLRRDENRDDTKAQTLVRAHGGKLIRSYQLVCWIYSERQPNAAC